MEMRKIARKLAFKHRQRINPIRKWTKEEVIQIVDYIRKTGNWEKPTSQVYYKNLQCATKINARWELIKCKVRYLRKTFQKAAELLNVSADSQDVNALQAQILRICPHYHQLKDIFEVSSDSAIGNTKQPQMEHFCFSQHSIPSENSPLTPNEKKAMMQNQIEASPTTITLTNDDSLHIIAKTEALSDAADNDDDVDNNDFDEQCSMADVTLKPLTSTPIRMHKYAASVADKEHSDLVNESSNTLAHVKNATKVNSDYVSFQREKLKRKIEAFEKLFQLKKEKMNLKLDMKKRELELAERELQLKYELKKLKLETQERTTMSEILMKYA